MNVTSELSRNQQRFRSLVEHCPEIALYWDWNTRSLDIEPLQAAINSGYMSHGETILARFFAELWLADGQFQFDIFAAAKELDDEHYSLIAGWCRDPFFP